ncbi:hypothetical protein EVAR_56932_1 [Eumeta japonica]|uniref:Uncharacterized protein n=1 Tax=Eumeta variegata TaxID=151549 RepID=A0A4C1YEN5_EUMVA|nr:hypothetical protein EVAR_56932_1 [Eumeta japonica]
MTVYERTLSASAARHCCRIGDGARGPRTKVSNARGARAPPRDLRDASEKTISDRALRRTRYFYRFAVPPTTNCVVYMWGIVDNETPQTTGASARNAPRRDLLVTVNGVVRIYYMPACRLGGPRVVATMGHLTNASAAH